MIDKLAYLSGQEAAWAVFFKTANVIVDNLAHSVIPGTGKKTLAASLGRTAAGKPMPAAAAAHPAAPTVPVGGVQPQRVAAGAAVTPPAKPAQPAAPPAQPGAQGSKPGMLDAFHEHGPKVMSTLEAMGLHPNQLMAAHQQPQQQVQQGLGGRLMQGAIDQLPAIGMQMAMMKMMEPKQDPYA